MDRSLLALSVFLVFLFLLGCTGSKSDSLSVSEQTSSSTSVVPSRIPDSSSAPVTHALPSNSSPAYMMSDFQFPKPPVFDFENKTNSSGSMRVLFFYSPLCEASRATVPLIETLNSKYPGFAYEEYNIASQNGSLAYVSFADSYHLNSSLRMVPQILINGTILTDRFNIADHLEPYIIALENSR
ncbi:hypothetical protein HY990_03885 [Candidatus Micrarchaeota archaeon]|nr:hypothetical protein [Candidatus Micrarchaeota archaeon]